MSQPSDSTNSNENEPRRVPSWVKTRVSVDLEDGDLPAGMQLALEDWANAGGRYRQAGRQITLTFDGQASASERERLLGFVRNVGAEASAAAVVETAFDPDPGDGPSGSLLPFHRSTGDRFIGPSSAARGDLEARVLASEAEAALHQGQGRHDPCAVGADMRRRAYVSRHLTQACDWAQVPDWIIDHAFVPVDTPMRLDLSGLPDRWQYMVIRALDVAREDLADAYDLPLDAIACHANPDGIQDEIDWIVNSAGDTTIDDPHTVNTLSAGLERYEQRVRGNTDARVEFPGYEGHEGEIELADFQGLKESLAERCGVDTDTDLRPSGA